MATPLARLELVPTRVELGSQRSDWLRLLPKPRSPGACGADGDRSNSVLVWLRSRKHRSHGQGRLRPVQAKQPSPVALRKLSFIHLFTRERVPVAQTRP